MVDTISVNRGVGESFLTILGFAPSGAPSGSSWPTGAHSYASPLLPNSDHDSLTVVSHHVSLAVIGATGPQPSGAGTYQAVPAVDIADTNFPSRYALARPGGMFPIGSAPIQATGGYYSPIEAPQSPHDANSVADKIVPLPATSGSSAVTLYRLRARDASGPLTDPTRFVYWTSSVVSLASYTGSLPFGGPLVELTTLDSWISGT